MNRSRLFAFCAIVVLGALVALGIPGVARAQGGDAGIASQLFDAGRDLMKRGDFPAACPKLVESARLEPRVGTLARLAECEEKIGHVASARGHWKDTVELARAQKDDRLAHAEDELKRVDALVPRLVLKMATAAPAGFTVLFDSVTIGTESVGLALPIDPGHHTLTANATNKTAWTTTVDTKPDGATTTIEIPALQDKAHETLPVIVKQELPPPVVVVPPPRTHRPLVRVGVVTMISGALVAGAGFGFGAAAIVLNNNAQAEGCQPNGLCFAGKSASDHDLARTFADMSTFTVVTGGVLAAVGLAVLVFAPRVVEKTALRIDASGIGGAW